MPLKTCPKCENKSGPRTQLCSCGHDFFAAKAQKSAPTSPQPKPTHLTSTSPEPKTDQAKPERFSNYNSGRIMVSAPAGQCPFDLTNIDPHSIDRWAEKVRDDFDQRNQTIGTKALVYFARQFYEYNSPEFRTVKNHLYGA